MGEEKNKLHVEGLEWILFSRCCRTEMFVLFPLHFDKMPVVNFRIVCNLAGIRLSRSPLSPKYFYVISHSLIEFFFRVLRETQATWLICNKT